MRRRALSSVDIMNNKEEYEEEEEEEKERHEDELMRMALDMQIELM